MEEQLEAEETLDTRSEATRLTKLDVEGMTCSSCVAKIENHLKQRRGILTVSVSLVLMKAEVKYDPTVDGAGETKIGDEDNAPSADRIVEWVNELGFEASVSSDVLESDAQKAKNSGALTARVALLHQTGQNRPQPLPPKIAAAVIERLQQIQGVAKATGEGGRHQSEGVQDAVFEISYDPALTGNRHFLLAIMGLQIVRDEGYVPSIRAKRQDEADLRKAKQKKEIDGYRRAFLISLPFAIIILVRVTPHNVVAAYTETVRRLRSCLVFIIDLIKEERLCHIRTHRS